MIIDSHAHLDYPQLAADLPAVLARADEAGVDQVISIGVKLTTADEPRKIAETYDNVWFSVGVHPHEAGNEDKACNMQAFLDAADHPKCVAIGEAGLDYHYDYAPRDRQAESFRAQIRAARALVCLSSYMRVRPMRILPKLSRAKCGKGSLPACCIVSVRVLTWLDGHWPLDFM